MKRTSASTKIKIEHHFYALAVLLIMVFMMNHDSMNALAATNKTEKAAVKAQVVKLMKNVKTYNVSGIVKCYQPANTGKVFLLSTRNDEIRKSEGGLVIRPRQ